jgi:hypothetical protein
MVEAGEMAGASVEAGVVNSAAAAEPPSTVAAGWAAGGAAAGIAVAAEDEEAADTDVTADTGDAGDAAVTCDTAGDAVLAAGRVLLRARAAMAAGDITMSAPRLPERHRVVQCARWLANERSLLSDWFAPRAPTGAWPDD